MTRKPLSASAQRGVRDCRSSDRIADTCIPDAAMTVEPSRAFISVRTPVLSDAVRNASRYAAGAALFFGTTQKVNTSTQLD